MTYGLRAVLSGFVLVGVSLAAGCQSDQNSAQKSEQTAQVADRQAVAVIAPSAKAPADEKVTGEVTFRQEGEILLVVADLSGFKPNTTHGIHIHESGDLSAPDLASAKGHFNPAKTHHGAPGQANSHGGDLGNIQADAKGHAHKQWRLNDVSLGDGSNSVVGRSVIIHAGEDDLKTDPAGNSGGRIAGGVIRAQ